jgi:hypothetical protein
LSAVLAGFGGSALRFVGVEYGGAVLRPDVGPLPVELSRIVERPERIEEGLVRDGVGVEGDADGFGAA